MSTSIDNRVVQAQFDNKNFEKNVGVTLKTLDKLEKSLELKGATKGFDELDKAARHCDLANIGRAAELVQKRLSTMGMVGVTMLQNITNKAINAGERMLKAFTIQPIMDGFSEYELKMGSVQTIVASTGESLATVNDYLEELNKYSDKTIYSFKDMTASIGKFTNAGVPLEQAVLAIQGISNEAAVSGANAEEASRAMYNFSQALSAGYVKLIDWKSIENANMATKEFKQQLIDTAVAMGTLKTAQNGMYKAGKTTMNATKNFNDSLQEQWMTSEVLIETLRRYADETTDIGKKAFAAAQDIKTFHQLMDTVKESIGSVWAQISEIIFGDLEEAKKLWTSIGNAMSNFIENAFGGVVGFLKNNLSSNYKKFMENGPIADINDFNKRYKEAVDEQRKPIQDEINHNNQLIRSRELALKDQLAYSKYLAEGGQGHKHTDENGKEFWWRAAPQQIESTADEVLKLKQRNEELEKQMSDNSIQADVFRDTMLRQFDDVDARMTELMKVGYSYEEGLAYLGFTKEQYHDMMKWRKGIRDGTIDVDALVASFDETARREKIFRSFGNVFKFLGSTIKPFTNAFKNVFFGADTDELWLGKLIDRIDKYTSNLKISEDTMKKATDAFEQLFGWVKNFGSWALPKLKAGFDKVSYAVGAAAITVYHFIASFIEFIDPIQMATDAYEYFGQVVEDFKGIFKSVMDDLGQDPHIGPTVNALKDVVEQFNNMVSNPILTEDGRVLTKGYQKLWYTLRELPDIFEDAFKDVEFNFDQFVDTIVDKFNTAAEEGGGTFKKIYDKIVEYGGKIVDAVKNFAKTIIDNLGFIVSSAYVIIVSYGILRIVSFFDALTGAVTDFLNLVKEIPRSLSRAIGRISKAVAFEKRAEGIKHFADAMLSLSIAVGILAGVFYVLSKMDDVEAMERALDVLAKIVAMISIMAVIVGFSGDWKSAASLGAISLAFLAVAGAAYILSQVNFDDTSLSTWAGLLDVILIVGSIIWGMSEAGKLLKSVDVIKVAFSMFAAISALYLCVRVLEKINNADIDLSGEMILKVIGVFFAVTKLMDLLGKAGGNAGKAGFGLLGLSLSLYLLLGIIDILADYSGNKLMEGIGKLAILGLVVGGFMLLTRLAGDNAHKAALSLLALGIAMIPITAAFVIFGKLEWEEIWKGVTAFGLIMVALGAALWMAKSFNASFRSLLGIVAVITVLGIIIGGLAAVAYFAGGKTLAYAAGSLVAVILALSALMFTMSFLAKTATWTSLGAMAGQVALIMVVVGSLAYIMAKLSEIPENKAAVAMNLMLAIGAIVLELTAVMAVCALLGAAGPVALQGLLVLDAILLNFGIILGGFAALEQYFPGTAAFFETGIPLLKAIGEGIGQLIGGVIGGIGTAVMENMVTMSEQLIDICTNITTASDALTVQEDFGSKIAGVAGALMALTAADFVEGVKNFFSIFGIGDGGDTFSDLKGSFKGLGEALKALGDAMGNVNLSNIQMAGNVSEQLAGVLQSLSGAGLKNKKVDPQLLTDFGEGVKSFAHAIGLISIAKTAKVDRGRIDDVVYAGEALSDMADKIPNGGESIASWFVGDNLAGDFGTQIKNFASAIAEADDYEIVTKNIETLKDAGILLSEMADEIPEFGGKWEEIFGTSSPDKFGENIVSFGESLETIGGMQFDMQTYAEMQAAVTALTLIAKMINGTDVTNISAFKNAMDEFLGWFSVLTVDGPDGVTASMESILSSMVEKINRYGAKFKRYGRNSMRDYVDGIESEGGSARRAVEVIMEVLVRKLNVYSDVYGAGEFFIQGFINGMNAKAGVLYDRAYEIAKNAVKEMKNGAQESSPSKATLKIGKYLDEGLILGLEAMSPDVDKSAYGVAHRSLQAMSDAIADINQVVDADMDIQPVITPVLDMSEVDSGMQSLSARYNKSQIGAIVKTRGQTEQTNSTTSDPNASNSVNVSYVQNNYSPKALSRIDIYRQTKNQISQIPTVKGVVKTV